MNKINPTHIALINAILTKKCEKANRSAKKLRNGDFPQNQYTLPLTDKDIETLERFLNVRKIESLENVGFYEKEFTKIAEAANDNGRTLAIIQSFFEAVYLSKGKALRLRQFYQKMKDIVQIEKHNCNSAEKVINEMYFDFANELDFYGKVIEIYGIEI